MTTVTNVRSETSRQPYADAFVRFLNLLKSAAVTYGRKKNGDRNYKNSKPEVRFNSLSSPNQYNAALSTAYENACNGIEQSINKTHYKSEKLFLITRYLVEVKTLRALLIKCNNQENTVYKHTRFSFSNLAQGSFANDQLTEDAFQLYYYLMDLYIDKCYAYLQSVERAIEVARQEDFPIPIDVISDQKTSSVEDPIAFFEYLLCKNGIEDERSSFMPSEEESKYYHVSYDAATEIKTILDSHPETGEAIQKTYQFRDKLDARCRQEVESSKRFIDNAILKMKQRDEIVLFIEVLLNRTKYLALHIKEENELKYPELRNSIANLAEFIHEKYRSFCPPNFELGDVVGNRTPTSQLHQPQIRIRSRQIEDIFNPGVFKWAKGEPNRLTGILYESLNGQLIADTDSEVFRSAFAGIPVERPLGIRWIDKPTNGFGVNKASLWYLFQCLCEKGLIDLDYDSPELLQKLEFVFADPEGKKFVFLAESRGNVKPVKRVTPAKRIINNAISVMISGQPIV